MTSKHGSLQSWHRRVETLGKRTGATKLVSSFILATDREDADRQVRQFVADHAGNAMTLFVMMRPNTKVA